MAITSKEPRAGFPLSLELIGDVLAKRSWVKISQIRTLSIKRIGQRISRISPENLSRIISGLNEILA